MGKTLLAKPAPPAPAQPPDQAALQRLVLRILEEEYGSYGGIWAQAAARAAARILQAVETVRPILS